MAFKRFIQAKLRQIEFEKVIYRFCNQLINRLLNNPKTKGKALPITSRSSLPALGFPSDSLIAWPYNYLFPKAMSKICIHVVMIASLFFVIECKDHNNPELKPPAKPTLASPTDDAVGVGDNLALTWNTALRTTTYNLQVSISNDFISPLVDVTGITKVNHDVSG